MGLLRNVWFRAVIDLVHDLAAGAWPGAVLAMWIVRTAADKTLTPGEVSTMVTGWTGTLGIMFWALGLIVATGIVRLNYRGLDMPPELLKSRTTGAWIKHVVFATTFITATVVGFGLLQ